MEHIESEIALKPELCCPRCTDAAGAYRIGDRAQAGTGALGDSVLVSSISNRRSRSSRNVTVTEVLRDPEHIESEIALKPERMSLPSASSARAYRIGDRAQAGTKRRVMRFLVGSISNRRSRSSRNRKPRAPMSRLEHIESEIALKPEPPGRSARRRP